MNFVQTLGDLTDPAEMSPRLEKEKSRFAGNEISGKTLGIVGLGAIGSLVADMALAMGMKVVGFDPALSIDAAWGLSGEVGRMENLASLLARSDYVSLHVPALDATLHMISADALAAVSYTHLDVYKRQVLVTSSSKAMTPRTTGGRNPSMV